jgi:hypothetical protein
MDVLDGALRRSADDGRWPVSVPPAACRAECATRHFARMGRTASRGSTRRTARGALRASLKALPLKTLEILITGSTAHPGTSHVALPTHADLASRHPATRGLDKAIGVRGLAEWPAEWPGKGRATYRGILRCIGG